ncbi:MAG: DUF2865 domain-containing protein [Pseudomonadota bacterium]
MPERKHTTGPRQRLAALTMLIVFVGGIALPALAQQWTWPWETEPFGSNQPREPAPRRQPRQSEGPSVRSDICLELERRLALEANRGRRPGDNPDALRQEANRLGRAVRTLEQRLERGNCWEQFFFQRSLRNTRTCNRLYREFQTTRQRYRDARASVDRLSSRVRRSYQEDIIRALSRNRCGPAYAREARRLSRDSFANFFFQDEDPYSERDRNRYKSLPFATYRTLCVRLCDGYYFPVSFSTLPNYFGRDAEACRSRCAAPTALYYYQNPGGSIDQMVSVNGQAPYKDLTTAFAYRKKFIKGCSCKQSEYVADGDVSNEAPSGDKAEAAKRRPLSPIR